LIEDPQCRVLYQPPYLMNSDATLDQFRYTPIFGFFVVEKNTATALRSTTVNAPIQIAGFVYPPILFQSDWTQPQSDFCFKSCQFPEDFKTIFPGTVAVEPLYMGGWDVQLLPISPIIQAISCEKKTEFFIGDGKTPIGTLPQPLTDTIDTTKGPNVGAALFFRPFPDGNNYKCDITYTLTNGVKESTDRFTLTFTMTPVNDAPRIIDTPDRIIVPENIKTDIIVKVKDPEDTPVTVTVVGCANNRGTFVVNGVTIDCKTNGPSTGIPIPVGPDGSVPVSFTGPPDQSGTGFNSITLKMSDGQNDAVATIPVDVIPINNNPTIQLGKGKFLISQEISVSDGSALVGKDLSLYEIIAVQDKECQDTQPMEVTITITAGEIVFSKPQFNNRIFTQKGLEYIFEGVASEINTLLNTLSWKTTEHVQDGTVTISVSDKGFSGKCMVNGVVVDGACVLKATVVAHVSSGAAGAVTNVAAIAGPTVAAAATVALAGVAAGVGLIGAGASSSSAVATAGFDAAFATGASQTSAIFTPASTGGSSAIFV